MIDSYLSQIDDEFNINIPLDLAKKLKINSNVYVKLCIKSDSTLELKFIKNHNDVDKIEGSLFLPDN